MSTPNLIVEIKLLHPDAKRPEYATDGAAGMDLSTLCRGMILLPGERYLASTGIAISIPKGWEAQIRPRSGWAYKHGVTVLNAPGTIDSDYRGEVKVLLINHGGEPFEIRRGDRIAQLVFQEVGRATLQRVEEFTRQTERGVGAFGSTGK